MQQNNSKQKIVAGSATALVVIVLLSAISFYENNHRSANAASTAATSLSTSGTSSTPSTSSSTATTPSTSATYKDGTYSATSNYYVPHGVESIKVTLTLKGGIVTDSNIVNSETNNESASYQEGFAQEYKSSVVGKNIKDVQLSYVAGASDTTNGFNDAVNSIINQAQS